MPELPSFRARGVRIAGLVAGLSLCGPLALAAQSGVAYEPATRGTRRLAGGNGLEIRMLVEASNLGGPEVELGEVTFPVGAGDGASPHAHGRVEILYILEGVFDHIVNGQAHRLEPGMVGIVRPGDEVVHRVIGETPVRALVIWAPGGEAARLAPLFEERPIEDPPSGGC